MNGDKRRSRALRALIVSLLFILCGLFGAQALAQASPEDPDVVMEGLKVEILWNNNSPVRIGRDAPVSVRVSSTSAEISGTVRVSVPISNGDYYVLEEAVQVSAGESELVVIGVPVDYATESAAVEFRGVDGTVYASETLMFRPDYSSQEVYVAVLSSDVSRLAAFDRVMLNEYRGTTTRLFDFQMNTLPVDADVLKMYDIFLWDDKDPEEMTEAQRAALSSWVYAGGVMITGADNSWGHVVENGEILRERWGKGQYVHCGFSLNEVALKYTGEDGICRFLMDTVGEQRLEEIEESIAYNTDYWNASAMTSSVDAQRIPNVWMYGMVLLVYLIVLGPLLYYVLKRRGRRQMLRSGMVLIALIFTAVIYLMGSGTRFRQPFVYYASIQEIRSGLMMETVYANASSPNNDAYRLEVGADFDVKPVLNNNYSGNVSWNRQNCVMRVQEDDGKVGVWVYDDIPFTSRLLRLNANGSSLYEKGFTGQATLFQDGFEGILVNETGQDFEQVCVFSDGKIALIGDWEAGGQRDLSQLETRHIYGQHQNAILKEITGYDGYASPGMSREASLASWRYQVLFYYFNNMMTDVSREAVIIGFPAVESGRYITSPDVETRGVTLVTEVIALNYEKQGRRYYPIGEEQIHVLQGSYNFLRNSTYENLCVLQYDFGDLEPEELWVTWPDTEMPGEHMLPFRWGMEFYNWETNTYDTVESKVVFQRQELQPYLSEDRRLTVRYAVESAEEYYYEIFLPEFDAVGRERR